MNSPPIVRVKVWGDFACFSRPEMKVERFSYECPTPSAARGILDAILWKPEMRWLILSISILNPLRFVSLKRNETIHKITQFKKWAKKPSSFEPLIMGAGGPNTTPRNTVALQDVAYIIEATPIVYDEAGDNSPQKYTAMFNRRVEKGQCFHRPALGCREFAADFGPANGEKPLKDLNFKPGRMLYDIIFDQNYKNNKPVFFNAEIESGVLNTRPEEVIDNPEEREEVLACWFKN
jgi:CRISPR-associated protein Cas5d